MRQPHKYGKSSGCRASILLIRSRLDAYQLTFLVILLSSFFVTPKNIWAFFFYTAIMPWTAFIVWKEWPRVLKTRVSIIVLILLIYCGVSVLWSQDASTSNMLKLANSALLTTFFYMAVLITLSRTQAATITSLRYLSTAAALNASAAIGVYAASGFAAPRMDGYAITYHQVAGSALMTVFATFSLYMFVKETRWWGKAGYAVQFLIQALFVFLTGSRGSFAALAVALIIFATLAERRWLPVIGAGAVVVLVGTVMTVPSAQDFVIQQLERPSFRLEIWLATLDAVVLAPWFGHGAAAPFGLLDHFQHPHSIYLSALYFYGAVGATIFLIVLAHLFLSAWRLRHEHERALGVAVLACPGVSGLTNFGQLVSGPDELWFVMWLPFALVTALAWLDEER